MEKIRKERKRKAPETTIRHFRGYVKARHFIIDAQVAASH